MHFLRLNSNHILPLLTEPSKPPFPIPMASSPPSSSSSAEPHNNRPPPSSNSTKPPPSPPPKSPSPPSPIYSSQPLTKPSNPSPQIPPKIQEPQPIIYPVASSGRAGFIPKSFRPQSSDQLVTVANSSGGGFPPRPVRGYGAVPGDHQVHLMRPPLLHHSQYGPRPGCVSASPMKTSSVAAQPKAAVAPYRSSAPDFSGYRDPRDTSRDDKLVTVHDRKVRLSDGDSLYALCRSWVRNGLPKEPQLPQFSEGLKLLPKPTDIPMQERNGSGNEEEYKEEDVGPVEHLSAHELLQLHVNRAKKIRSRLKKERLQRIERYKQRLSLLLPAPVEHIRNNTAES